MTDTTATKGAAPPPSGSRCPKCGASGNHVLCAPSAEDLGCKPLTPPPSAAADHAAVSNQWLTFMLDHTRATFSQREAREMARELLRLRAEVANLSDAHRQQIEAMRGTRDGVLRELQAVSVERDRLRAAASAEGAALRADAERYRWLRNQYRLMSPRMNGEHSWAPKMTAILKGRSIDAAIDAALAQATTLSAGKAGAQPDGGGGCRERS